VKLAAGQRTGGEGWLDLFLLPKNMNNELTEKWTRIAPVRPKLDEIEISGSKPQKTQ
jgi:hypothetical protein